MAVPDQHIELQPYEPYKDVDDLAERFLRMCVRIAKRIQLEEDVLAAALLMTHALIEITKFAEAVEKVSPGPTQTRAAFKE